MARTHHPDLQRGYFWGRAGRLTSSRDSRRLGRCRRASRREGMTTSQTFNPARLDLARRRRGMTKRALSESVGIPLRSLARYSKGESNPGAETITKFGRRLHFPSEFFYGPTLVEPPLGGASFRALSTLTARLRDQAIAAGSLGISLSEWIDKRFFLPASDVPRLQNTDPEAAAMAIRGRWSLGELPVKNLIHLLELHGVRVFSLAGETKKVDAYSFWHGDVPFIFLNTLKSAERSRMDAAHELGHLVLHSKSGSQKSRQAEIEAQQFGAAFLMSRASLLARMRWGANVQETIRAKHYWIVSVASLTYRMHTVGLLTEHQYRQAFAEIGRREYRSREPEAAPREKSQVFDKVFLHLREKGVTVAQVASDLSLYPDEVGKLLFGLVGFPIVVNERPGFVD